MTHWYLTCRSKQKNTKSFSNPLSTISFFFRQGEYTSEAVPYAIIGPLALLSAFFIFLLPETRNKALMDTIEHAGEFQKYDKTIVESETVVNLPAIAADNGNVLKTSDDLIVECKPTIHHSTIDTNNEATIVTNDGITIITNSDVANSDVANSDVANSDVANSDVANSDVAYSDVANSDVTIGKNDDVMVEDTKL